MIQDLKKVKDYQIHIVDYDDFTISYSFDQFESNKVLDLVFDMFVKNKYIKEVNLYESYDFSYYDYDDKKTIKGDNGVIDKKSFMNILKEN